MSRGEEVLAETLRAERLRIVAALIRTTRDWDLAEDAVADAAERALRTWPRDGVPRNPAAWLTTTAHRRALDVLRRAGVERAKLAQLPPPEPPEPAEEPPVIEDDRLRLVFTCCHPALSLEARVALTLKVVAGLSTADVARMFLVGEATMSQRLLRAKKRIAHTGIPYRVPDEADLPERLDGVLAVVYLVFTQGYAGAAAPGLVDEAVRLGRLLVDLLPGEAEVRGLLALMLAQRARRAARLVDGELVTLEEQDRSRWDRTAIAEAEALVPPPRGPYAVQAHLALVHDRAARAEDTDWPCVVALYDLLPPTPVVALNRAVAVGMADGPEAGLRAVEAVADEPALRGSHLLPAVRADLLQRAGRADEARTELERAATLAPTETERRQLLARRGRGVPSSG